MLGDRQVSAAIKNVSGNSADGEFGAKKSEFTVLQNAHHQGVSFGCDVEANPEQRQLCIQPIQGKQQTAFGKSSHVKSSTANVVETSPYYARTPEARLPAGALDVTGGTRLVLMFR